MNMSYTLDKSKTLKFTLKLTDGQRIRYLDLRKLRNELKLDLTGLVSSDLNPYRKFFELTKVQVLDISMNNFTDLACLVDIADTAKYLNELSLSRNKQLTLGRDCFILLVNLQILDLSRCSLKEIKSEQLNDLTKLISLDLSHNSIRRIDVNAIDNLAKLRTLNLSHNKLKSSRLERRFANMKTLEQLNLAHNRLEYDLGMFIGLLNLREIDLRENRLDKESFDVEILSTIMKTRHELKAYI